jgi:O-6-methylguanine DNA methyltransferase
MTATDCYATAITALGPALVAWSDEGVTAVWVAADPAAFTAAVTARTGRPLRCVDEVPGPVARALAGGDTDGIALDLRDLTPFRRQVLATVATIPRGEVRSYGWVAAGVGRPRAVRAVGTAVARNPVPLLVPCHRVVRTDGGIGQFGFGTEAKRSLLAGEGCQAVS